MHRDRIRPLSNASRHQHASQLVGRLFRRGAIHEATVDRRVRQAKAAAPIVARIGVAYGRAGGQGGDIDIGFEQSTIVGGEGPEAPELAGIGLERHGTCHPDG